MLSPSSIALTRRTFVGRIMSLLFNMLSRLVITFFPRSKRLLISWLQLPSTVILKPQKIQSVTVYLSICHEVMGPDAMISVFWMLSFKPTFSLSSFTFIKRLFSLLGLPHCRQTLYHLSHQGSPLDHSGLPEKFFRKNSRKTSTTSLTTLKPLTVWITTNLKILKEMGIPDHLFCLLINLYAG